MINPAALGQSEHPVWASRRLWSLWDMLTFNAANFYSVSTNLQEFQTLTNYGKAPETEPAALVDADSKGWLLGLAQQLADHLRVLGAPVTEWGCARLKDILERDGATWGDVSKMIEHVDMCLMDELSRKHLLVLDSKEEAYFNPADPLFGAEVATQFQTNGVYELDEAAKCLALGRSTATVFHLMRLMEIGIEAVRLCLGIPDPVKPADRNWGSILSKVDAAIKAKKGHWSNATDQTFFEEIYASLEAVRVAWRNTTMHVEKKYTQEEAEHICLAVKGFMKKLASRVDENGQPLA